MAGMDVALTPSYSMPLVLFGGGSFTSAKTVGIADYSQINLNVIVTGSSSTETLTVDIEHSFDPNVPASWTTITQLSLTYTTGTATVLSSTHDMLTGPGLGPYIRLKASLDPEGTGILVYKAFLARAVLRE